MNDLLLTEKTVAGIHFVQEDSPDEIGRAVADWMRALATARPTDRGDVASGAGANIIATARR